MEELGTIAGVLVAAGSLGWVGKAIANTVKARGENLVSAATASDTSIESLLKIIKALDERITLLESENTRLRVENLAVHTEVAALKLEIQKLELEVRKNQTAIEES